MSSPSAVAIVGPTATGKSDLAVRLALALGGEIVNADSMQLYRGMDIGTAKLTPAERHGVPHHVLDVWPVTAAAAVADYQARARAAIADVAGRGRVPILVGGSGLYVRAVLDDLRFPGTDPDVRARLEAELAELADRGPTVLHARLAAVDPAAAAAIDVSNTRRVIRALEVVEITGRPFTAVLPTPGEYAVPAVQIGLDRDSSALDAAVARRVDRMLVDGLVSEVTTLVGHGLREGRTASRALGYAQVLQALDDAAAWRDSHEHLVRWARDATVAATRRFVRRQRSWFGRDERITWLDADAPELARRAIRVIRAGRVGAPGAAAP